MNIPDYIGDDKFLEIVGFEVQNDMFSFQTQLPTPTHTQNNDIIPPQINNRPTENEFILPSENLSHPAQLVEEDDVNEDESFYESGDSFESDDDLLTEELQYNLEEMYEWTATNRSLRHSQLNEPLSNEVTTTVEATTHSDVNARDVQLCKWPDFLTTYEGGYESDQRASDDESRKLSDDESDVDLPDQKRRKEVAYTMFNEKTDMKNVELFVGLRFTSREIFKKVVLAYSIQQHKDLIYMKNDKRHIHLGCSLCKWEVTAGPDLGDATGWQIKSMQPIHNCLRTMKNRLITEIWLAQEYLDNVLRDPLISPAQIKDDMKTRYEIIVCAKKCQRAKERALNVVTTLMQNQYGVFKPYLLELVKSNPGTTCILKTLQGDSSEPKTFKRFYVCFNALKKSFLETCRPIFGLDGCFLKHACGGQLLCAVDRDGNNHMFPIAWAVVERENRSSWEWFCNLLSEDLKMEDGDGWAVISDQQKGLTDAIAVLWSSAEHRNCARHIYSNWSKNHKGKVLERQFWKCVKATSKGQYESDLANLKEISKEAHDDFNRRNPEHFCKSFFKTHSCCDVVDNNMAKTFNSFILLSRYKPIVTMLEDIRVAIMERMRKKQELVGKFVGGVAPRISLKLEESYNQQYRCECRWNGDDKQYVFEVIQNGVSHAVDIDKKTCSCRSWELTGIPCCHGMSALLYMRIQPENVLPKWYTLDTYKQTYSNLLKPVPGSTFWDHEGDGMVLPPDIVKSKTGGRRRKARRRDVDEIPKSKNKYCRKGLPTKCGICGEQGHDKRKCQASTNSTEGPSVQNVPTRVWNRGRKKGGTNRLGRPSNDVLTPSEYVKTIRGNKGATTSEAREGNTSLSWLQAVVAKRGRARTRGRGSMSHGRSTIPQGVGVYYGNEGEVVYRANMTAPSIVINNPTDSQLPRHSEATPSTSTQEL